MKKRLKDMKWAVIAVLALATVAGYSLAQTGQLSIAGWLRTPTATLKIGAIADGQCGRRNGVSFEGVTCGGGGGAPTDAKYITQTANGSLSAEQSLGALGTGILLNTTTSSTGVLSIAAGSNLPGMVASGASHSGGAVPDPGSSSGTTKFLREDASWQVPSFEAPLTFSLPLSRSTNTISANVFVASGASHATGIVPDPGASSGTTKFLREDATWQVPPGGSAVQDWFSYWADVGMTKAGITAAPATILKEEFWTAAGLTAWANTTLQTLPLGVVRLGVSPFSTTAKPLIPTNGKWVIAARWKTVEALATGKYASFGIGSSDANPPFAYFDAEYDVVSTTKWGACWARSGATQCLVSTVSLVADTYANMILVFDGTDLHLSVNGEDWVTQAAATDLPNTALPGLGLNHTAINAFAEKFMVIAP